MPLKTAIPARRLLIPPGAAGGRRGPELRTAMPARWLLVLTGAAGGRRGPVMRTAMPARWRLGLFAVGASAQRWVGMTVRTGPPPTL